MGGKGICQVKLIKINANSGAKICEKYIKILTVLSGIVIF